MNDKEIRFAYIALVAIVAVACVIVGNNMYVKWQTAQLIKSGVPALEARCALSYVLTQCPNR